MPTGAELLHSGRYYLLRQYLLQNGSQLGRLHQVLQQRRWHGPALVLEALVAAHMPQVLVVEEAGGMDELHLRDEDDAAEPLFESVATTLIEATAYSPLLAVGEAAGGRIFEWRVYHSPTLRQFIALHERFAGPEIPIFHRTGIHPVLYGSTVCGPHMPNLTYFTPFSSLADREQAWTRFQADPEWHRVRQESIDRSGQIANEISIALYRVAAYSPVK